jgi:FtsZ-interacting cell division protein ZipA
MPRTATTSKNTGKGFPVLVGALVIGALVFGGGRKKAPASASAPSTPDVPPSVKRKAAPAPKPSTAKTLAQRLADNVRAKKYDYDRALCKSFQTQAKIAVDGTYGPDTRNALIKAGVVNPPPALFAPAKKKPPTPAPSTPPAAAPVSDEQLEKEVLEAVAKKLEAQDSGAPASPPSQTTEPTTPDVSAASLAQRLAADVRANKLNYDRALCRAFQIAATGLVVDGFYGGSTFNALKAYGVQNPPPALFKPAPSAAPYRKPTGS